MLFKTKNGIDFLSLLIFWSIWYKIIMFYVMSYLKSNLKVIQKWSGYILEYIK